MAIPKVIYQTFIHNNLPPITKLYIRWMKYKNPTYKYEFYDDARIEEFFKNECSPRMYAAYSRIAIGAAKADFFRYAVLHKHGGVYLDVDGYAPKSLNKLILEEDEALISPEKNLPQFYAQYGLIFNKNHPFLLRVLNKIMDNIEQERFTNDVHLLTGPTVFTNAINECIKENIAGNYRIYGLDFNGFLKRRHFLNRLIYNKNKQNHWRNQQKRMSVLK